MSSAWWRIQGDAPGQDCGSEAEDCIMEGDASGEHEVLEGQVQGDDRGEFVEGDASGEHDDEEVPVQVQGSPRDVSEHEGEAFVVVGLENYPSHLIVVLEIQYLRKS